MGGLPVERILAPLYGGGEAPIVRYSWSSPQRLQLSKAE